MVTARQHKADATRHRLFATAVQLFARHGFHATTVEAIARKVGVAKGTFFVHFPTKDAVVLELVRRQTDAARAARAAALGDGPLAALRATVMTLAAQAGLSRELSRAVLAATLSSQALADAADVLFEEVLGLMIEDARAAAPRRAPDHLARGLMAAYLGAAFHFAANPTSAPMTELLAPLVADLLPTQEPRRAPLSPRPPRRPPRR